jgi:dynactin 1
MVVGSFVELANNGRGVVKFIGKTDFAAGKWIGIELTEPMGKNDGTVLGVRYFSCPDTYGVFVRENQIVAVSQNSPGSSPRTSTNPPSPRLTRSRAGRSPERTRHIENRVTTIAYVAEATNAQSVRSKSPSRIPQRSNVISPQNRATSSNSINEDIDLMLTTPPKLSTSSLVEAKDPDSAQNQDLSIRCNFLENELLQLSQRYNLLLQTSQNEDQILEMEQQNSQLKVQVGALQNQLKLKQENHEKDLKKMIADIENLLSENRLLKKKHGSSGDMRMKQSQSLCEKLEDTGAKASKEIEKLTEHLENAILDKELAEERSEILGAQVRSLNEKINTLEAEINGNDKEEPAGSVKDHEKENKLLRAALVKLRKITLQREANLTNRINELELAAGNIVDVQNLSISLSNAKIRIEHLEAQIVAYQNAAERLTFLTGGTEPYNLAETVKIIQDIIEIHQQIQVEYSYREKLLSKQLQEKSFALKTLAGKLRTSVYYTEQQKKTIETYKKSSLKLSDNLKKVKNDMDAKETLYTKLDTIVAEKSECEKTILRLTQQISKIDFECKLLVLRRNQSKRQYIIVKDALSEKINVHLENFVESFFIAERLCLIANTYIYQIINSPPAAKETNHIMAIVFLIEIVKSASNMVIQQRNMETLDYLELNMESLAQFEKRSAILI